jgi:hypothetical protein
MIGSYMLTLLFSSIKQSPRLVKTVEESGPITTGEIMRLKN